MICIVLSAAQDFEVLPSCEEHGADKDGQDNLGVCQNQLGVNPDCTHTKGSPQEGRWNIGSLFHAGGTSVTVRLRGMVCLWIMRENWLCPVHGPVLYRSRDQRLVKILWERRLWQTDRILLLLEGSHQTMGERKKR